MFDFLILTFAFLMIPAILSIVFGWAWFFLFGVEEKPKRSAPQKAKKERKESPQIEVLPYDRKYEIKDTFSF
jgi:heme/copper-type cytochrome/quinol oxidase subunit 2|tara:strand:+ start:1501 stop:1716 length:216 start_codon:yes stop_codon:yes gene_type:complete